jgi:hypothetical protein
MGRLREKNEPGAFLYRGDGGTRARNEKEEND